MFSLSGTVTTAASFLCANVLRKTEYTDKLLHSIPASSLNVPYEHIPVMLSVRIPSIPVLVLRVLWFFNLLWLSASSFCCWCFFFFNHGQSGYGKKWCCCDLVVSVVREMNLAVRLEDGAILEALQEIHCDHLQ